MSLSHYSAEQWLELRPMIERLYSEHNLTQDQICNHLRCIGFRVNTRMVKTRLLNWGLQKKLHLPELRAALQILGPDRSRWPSQTPRFCIHRRVVELDDILRSLGRKGIQDPFNWILNSSDEDYQPCSPVQLVAEHASAINGESAVAGQLASNSSATQSQSPDPASNVASSPDSGVAELSACAFVKFGSRQRRLKDPEVHLYAITAFQEVQSYCSRYMLSTISLNHLEPEVHHLTSHARFLDRMDEGLALLSATKNKKAFKRFGNGFDLLKDVLTDAHPMAVATYLLVLCKLGVSKETDIAASLLSYTQRLASVVKSDSLDIRKLICAVWKSDELVEMPVRCLHAASDVLNSSDPTHWKALYVNERYCDALYHAQTYGELATRRRQLLGLQETKYGPNSRNVLWTSLNVADDHLIHGQLDLAQTRFEEVKQQSNQHSGYHRAKSRVVALEGLAKIAYLKASQHRVTRSDGISATWRYERVSQSLLAALQYANEASQLAQGYFERGSRRTKRVAHLREKVNLELADC